MAEQKKTLSAKQVVADIREGATDEFLMKKYGVSEKGLQSLFQKLITAKILTQAMLDDRNPEVEVIIDTPTTPPPPRTPLPPRQTSSGAKPDVARQVDVILSDLAQMDFSDEVLPINEKNLRELKRDFVFWCVSCLGIVPLFIATLSNNESQLVAFALFFSIGWGLIFKRLVLQDLTGWKFSLGAFCFTGIIGIILLFIVYAFMPPFYLQLARSNNAFASLIGFIFQVGVWEELCKILPVLLYIKWMAWKREAIDPMMLLSIGIFSGLGFAAFENVDYSHRFMLRSVAVTMQHGYFGAASATGEAMVVVMLRALSLVFCHAVWTGIFSYFVAVAAITGRRWGALLIVGLVVSAVLHGFYDWLTTMQMTLAALTAGFSFMLFYAYLSKLKAMPISEKR